MAETLNDLCVHPTCLELGIERPVHDGGHRDVATTDYCFSTDGGALSVANALGKAALPAHIADPVTLVTNPGIPAWRPTMLNAGEAC